MNLAVRQTSAACFSISLKAGPMLAGFPFAIDANGSLVALVGAEVFDGGPDALLQGLCSAASTCTRDDGLRFSRSMVDPKKSSVVLSLELAGSNAARR